jgi:small subunit ribosomal protein S11
MISLESKKHLEEKTRISTTSRAHYKHTKPIVIHIRSTYNNTLVVVTSSQTRTTSNTWHQVIYSGSRGSAGFRGSRKKTPYAAKIVTEIIFDRLPALLNKTVRVYLSGCGRGRDIAINRIYEHPSIMVKQVRDFTPLPHNGCRSPKRRRV